MKIVLTHEQADFDALASLLGAWLLDESSLPVLPNRMNRNVRAFINLYGAELPFIERRDLPAEPVEYLTLVDTQSMVSIRGVGAKTAVHVVDHHSRRAGLPDHWIVTSEETGAVTTLFVEALQEQNDHLKATHATLLLLGIYEDTGSLTYTRTTSRDLRAAAYLLEQGANLPVAVDFLNHPLSLEQQALYENLCANIQSHPIHGHKILIACGEAMEMEEELSSIAHKLRDLLDPDALFMLVKTKGGVQFIARSTSDQIDVAEIASRFGGGGHERASAGLIRERTLEDIYVELVRILPEYVRPAVTVAQIMSFSPQLLSADTPVEEAAQRMQRYGYEGYPIIQDRKVIGLLTRRAVDRAISHRLNLTAASLMEAGEVVVRPDDSIEYLQRVMTETGWGQVPVIHPETGDIIGIVTRTDLLKTLAPEPRLPGHLNLAEKLETSLPSPHLVLLKAIAQAAHELHLPVYIVGGFVRDLLLERPSLDFDIVVEGDAITLAQTLAAHHGGRVTSHGRFGTAKWHLPESGFRISDVDTPPDQAIASNPKSAIDLISARTEFYTHPTALPTVERGSIKLDLHRRDFTINTLALRLDGNHYGDLYDYWGGLDDLRRGLVRVLHSVSFVDDPTRMLRAVRFEQRFGLQASFQIEDRTLQLLREAVPLIHRISGERIRHELDHILDEQRSIPMLARLDELGLLHTIHPDLKWDEWIRKHIEMAYTLPPPDWGLDSHGGRQPLERVLAYAVWIIRLPPEHARLVLERLRLPAAIVQDILQACTLYIDLPSLGGKSPSTVVARLDGMPLLALYATYLASDDPQAKDRLQSYAIRWRNIHASITGDDLRQRGIPPGPIYTRILTALRKAWLDGEIATPKEEAELLEELIQDTSDVDH
jgi:tRNA nucleotidyltransferase (CCA-adding enzyme)